VPRKKGVGAVSDRRDYRREADFCEDMASKATDSDLKASWLRLAADWLSMITQGGAPLTAEQKFDDMAQAKGTGQKDSKASH
jgi:hypothetical protein